MASLLPTLVGRVTELATLRAWWAGDGPLLSLVGAGGVGKTTLARRLTQDLDSLCWFADLSGCTTGHDVDSTLADVAGGQGRVEEGLAAGVLLLLDNVEQVVDAVAERVPGYVQAGARVLMTSRLPLDLPGEQVVSLRPLDVAGGVDSAAAQLFAERVHQRTGQAPGPDDAEAIAEIVRRVDGLPLALELAASRVRTLGIAGVRDRLDSLLLARPRRSRRVDRHASLHAVIQWSWDLLSEEERRCLAGCALFAGSFDLAAVEAVLADPMAADDLEALVLHHLVEVETGTTRHYRLLATTRAFALDRLAERDDRDTLRTAHTAHTLRDALEDARLDVILAEHADLRAVLNRHLPPEHDADRATVVRAAWLMRPALMLHPLAPEVQAELVAHVDAPDTHPEWKARAWCVLGSQAYFWGTVDDAAAAYENAHRLLEDGPPSTARVSAASSLFATRMRQGRLAEARPIAEAALSAAESLDPDSALTFRARFNLVALLHGEGHLEDARNHALVLVARGGSVPALLGRALHTLGFIDFEREDLPAAQSWFEQCLAASPEPDLFHLRCRGNLAMLHHYRGDVEAARTDYRVAVDGLAKLSCRADEGEFRVALATLEARAGHPAVAADELARAERAFAAQPLDASGWLVRLHGAVVDDSIDSAAVLAELAQVPAAAKSWELWFHRHLLGSTSSFSGVEVGEDGRWFQLAGGAPVDLSRRGAMRRILGALATARETSPGKPLDRDALFSAGWPGQTIDVDSAAHRVRVALSSLRKQGLDDVVKRDADGWFLDPVLPFRWGGPKPPSG